MFNMLKHSEFVSKSSIMPTRSCPMSRWGNPEGTRHVRASRASHFMTIQQATAMDVYAMERGSFHAVVRALFACGRLQSRPWETELLLTDLQDALGISEQERLIILQQVEQDSEALNLATFPEADGLQAQAFPAPQPQPLVAVAEPIRPSVVMAEAPFYPVSTSAQPSSKSKAKKAPSASGGAWKPQGGSKKSKAGGGTPSTPKSLQPKGSVKSSTDKRTAAQKAVDKAQVELERLNVREREIFEALLALGVQDDDPELNEVQRSLLKWYRMDVRQREIEKELFG